MRRIVLRQMKLEGSAHLFASLLVLLACGPTGKAGVELVGSFKDANNNRIYTFRYERPDSAAIRSHAEGLTWTPRQLLAAYYYPKGSVIPADGVTLGENVLQVNDVIYETRGLSRWRFAYVRNLNGSAIFLDCEANSPEEGLCRK